MTETAEVSAMRAPTGDTMPGAVYVGDGRILVQDVPVPQPGPDQLLVEVAACGICGTDLHLVLERFARPGSILGHEWSGTVVATGGDHLGWSPGDRVVGNPAPGCGECRPCRRGRPSVCQRRRPTDYLDIGGAFCRYIVVPAAKALRVPDGLSVRSAALTEPTAIAIHAVGLGGATPGDRVLVTGAGPVGLLTIAVLRAQGVDDITVSEPSELRRDQAMAVGAAAAIAPDALEEPAMAMPVARPFAVAFECSGRASAAESAFAQLDYAGTLVLVGTGSEPPRFNQNRMIIFELEVIGAYNYDAEGFGPALDLLGSGRLPLDLLIEHEDVALDGIMGALERMSQGQVAGKVLVRPEAL